MPIVNKKITEMDAVTTLAVGDLFTVVSDPGGTPINKKITVANVKTELNHVSAADATDLTDGNATTLHYHTDILVTAVPGTDVTASGIKITLTAGENVVFGEACYIKSDGKAWKADATVIGTSSAIVLAIATIAGDASGSFLLMGVARQDSWAWSVGGLIYLSETAGALTQNAPTPTDTVTQVLGVATHADRVLFTPQLVQVEHT